MKIEIYKLFVNAARFSRPKVLQQEIAAIKAAIILVPEPDNLGSTISTSQKFMEDIDYMSQMGFPISANILYPSNKRQRDLTLHEILASREAFGLMTHYSSKELLWAINTLEQNNKFPNTSHPAQTIRAFLVGAEQYGIKAGTFIPQ